MAASVTWDAGFEADPGDLDEAKYGASEIRELKLAISEREEEEHNFKTGTQPFHKGGKCSVVFSGTTAEINALTDMGGDTENVTLAWDEDLKVLKYYNGSAWAIFDIDHGQLSGKGDDDHPQYLNLTKASQTITQNVAVSSGKTIDGRDISADGATLDAISVAYTSGMQAMSTMSVNTLYGPGGYDRFVIATVYTALPPYKSYGRFYSGPTSSPLVVGGVYVYELTYGVYQSITYIVPAAYYWKFTLDMGSGFVLAGYIQ